MVRRVSIVIILAALLLNACSAGELAGQPVRTQPSPITSPMPALPGSTPAVDPSPQPAGVPVEQWVEDTLSRMTLQQKVGQVIISGMIEQAITPEMCLHMEVYMPGGVILEGESIHDPQQVREFVRQIEDCAAKTQPVPMFITVTHEGANVNRFKEGVTVFPGALAQGATGDAQVAYQLAEISGRELAYSGFNMVLGPVADVLRNLDNTVIGERSFGSDPSLVSQYVAEAVIGYNAAGIIPVLKHYPGHGGVAADSHESLPIDNASEAELDELYLPPFASGIAAGAPVIMTSHIAFPQISGDDTPTTLSKEMLNDLRSRLGFQGVIMSDAMHMKAITGEALNIRRASLAAINAGVDLLLLNWPGNAGLVHKELVDAVLEERVSAARLDEAVRRVLTLKAERGLTAYTGVDAPQPDWALNQQTADAIAGRAISVLRDPGGNLPLSDRTSRGAGRILVLAPHSDWNGDQALVTALQEHGALVELRRYPAPGVDAPLEQAPPGDADLEEILAAAQNYARVVVFTWQAHLARVTTGADWQSRLVSGLQDSGKAVVVVAMRSPTDMLEFSEQTTVVGMMGMMPAQQAALVEVLLGERQAEGRNPLEMDAR